MHALWRPLDILVIALACATIATSYALLWRPATQGTQARITSPFQPPLYVQLDHEHHLDVTGALGDSRLQITPGAIRFIASPCRAKRCIHSGWIRLGGELAACLPNRIAVEILDASARLDAIAF